MIRLVEAVGVSETPRCSSNTTTAEVCSLLARCGGAQGGTTRGVADTEHQLTATGGVHGG